MSTFCGIMPEINYISIDRFTDANLKSRAYFLSHCHTDHMIGLKDREFESALIQNNAFLYMSHISKSIIDKMHSHLMPRIKELDMTGKNFIEIPDIDKTINVTLIPAGHCPGSVMFLFESDKTLLYTGDIRIRVNELQKYKQLFDLTGSLKLIDNIYLDTTFFKKSFENFPLREKSISVLCNLINNWLNQDEKNNISLITPAKYGSEYLFIEIYQNCKIPIHVDNDKYSMYRCFPEMDQVVTLDGTKTRIHNFCVGWNRKNIICLNHSYSANILNIKPSAMIWENFANNDCIIKKSYSNITSVCYSSHSSYSEIVDILKFLKPLQITPCVLPKFNHEKLEMEKVIKTILEEIHKTETSESENSDEEFENKVNWTNQETVINENSSDEDSNMDVFNFLDSPELKKKKL